MCERFFVGYCTIQYCRLLHLDDVPPPSDDEQMRKRANAHADTMAAAEAAAKAAEEAAAKAAAEAQPEAQPAAVDMAAVAPPPEPQPVVVDMGAADPRVQKLPRKTLISYYAAMGRILPAYNSTLPNPSLPPSSVPDVDEDEVIDVDAMETHASSDDDLEELSDQGPQSTPTATSEHIVRDVAVQAQDQDAVAVQAQVQPLVQGGTDVQAQDQGDNRVSLHSEEIEDELADFEISFEAEEGLVYPWNMGKCRRQ